MNGVPAWLTPRRTAIAAAVDVGLLDLAALPQRARDRVATDERVSWTPRRDDPDPPRLP